MSDITQAGVVHVLATHTYDEIPAGVADGSFTQSLSAAMRPELRQFGVQRLPLHAGGLQRGPPSADE